MECKGCLICTIIDTGSELNIVSKQIWDSWIRWSVHLWQTMAIADVNSGRGKLIGMVANVPLHCGTVKTLANLYVESHVSYELILGHPWKRNIRYLPKKEKMGPTYPSMNIDTQSGWNQNRRSPICKNIIYLNTITIFQNGMTKKWGSLTLLVFQ